MPSIDHGTFDDSPVHLCDRGKCAEFSLDASLQRFLWENSSIRSVRFCSDRMPCGRGLVCPWCAARKARRARAAMMQTATGYPRALMAAFTTKSHTDLAAAWEAQRAVRRQAFTAHSWLTKACADWTRATEVTWTSEGWHVHDHVLVLPRPDQEISRLGGRLVNRWATAAEGVSVGVHESGQKVSRAASVREALNYVHKTNFEQHGGSGRTLADILSGAQAGEVWAWDLWREVEEFASSGRHHMTASSPGFSTRGSDHAVD